MSAVRYDVGVIAYLQSIAKFPLLSYEDELKHAKQLYDGRVYIINMIQKRNDYNKLLDILSNHEDENKEILQELLKNLTPQNKEYLTQYLMQIGFPILLEYSRDNNELKTLTQQMNKARDLLVNSSLRLSASIAKIYTNSGTPYLDLIQEGNIGLILAVDKFNPHRGLKLGTVATWWIRQAIIRYLSNNSRVVRLPVHVIDAMQKAYRKLGNKLGRNPTPEEMQKEVKLNFNLPEIIEIMNIFVGCEYLDNYLDDEDGDTYQMLLQDTNVLVSALLEEQDTKESILKDFTKLTSREEKVMRLKVGF
jgi:RNA polymerase primary sigma factor